MAILNLKIYSLFAVWAAYSFKSRNFIHFSFLIVSSVLNEERPRTTTSRSQQQIRTESKFTATAGIRTRDHRDAGAPF
jgi:hypothetical protein